MNAQSLELPAKPEARPRAAEDESRRHARLAKSSRAAQDDLLPLLRTA